MVIVGLAGSGKRSLCKLSASLSEAKHVTIEVSKKYTRKDFHADFFKAMLLTITENKKVIISLSDRDLISDY